LRCDNKNDFYLSGYLTTFLGPSARNLSSLYACRRAHNDTQKLDCQELLQVAKQTLFPCADHFGSEVRFDIMFSVVLCSLTETSF
jgi:hypothetical protein